MSLQKFRKIYQSGSKPGVPYELAKIHKVLEDGIPSIAQFFRE